jgi:hypothetical protein
MTQTFSDAVVGPAALTHIHQKVWVLMGMHGRGLDLVGPFGRLMTLVVPHGSSISPGVRMPPGPKDPM